VSGPRRTLSILAGSGIAVLAVSALVVGWSVRAEIHRPFAAWDGAGTTVELTPGTTARQALELLAEAGVVRRPAIVAAWMRWSGTADDVQAGEYRFEVPASPVEVVARLIAGDVFLHPLTIPEGLTAREVADRVAAAGFGEAIDVRAVFEDPAPIRSFDPQAEDLEGYLFPETYRFPRGALPARVARTMVDRFLATVGDHFAERAAAVGLSPREAVVLASMIESETSVPAERARISRVFHNRLARGMKMQCDPTVRYAIERDGREVGRLSRADLRYASPWNTYVVAGLPPGPICSPGAASLEAAVAPADGDDLYFVAAPGGGHTFSRTLDAHLEAVRRWRVYLRSSR
jgi:UPF0755 protein